MTAKLINHRAYHAGMPYRHMHPEFPSELVSNSRTRIPIFICFLIPASAKALPNEHKNTN